MSKKDLLERLTRAPSDPLRPARKEDEAATRAPSDPAAVTRMSRSVVRRRAADRPEDTAPQPQVLRRRAAVIEEPAARRVAREPEPAAPAPEPEVTRVETPAPVQERPAPVEAAPVVERAPEPAPEPAAPAPAPTPEPAAPVAREPEPVAAAAPVTPAPAPEAAPAAVEKPAPVAAAPAAAPAREAMERPDAPRYAGLGKAVVMPPPGYDPTNPAAFRRRQEAERQTVDRRPAPTPGRRRMESPTDRPDQRPGGDAGRRRRGSAAPPHGRLMDRPNRMKRRKVAGQKASSPAPKAQKRKIRVDNVISVGQLAHELGVKASVVIRHLMDLGTMAGITQMLDVDTAALVAGEFDYEVENVGFQEHNYLESVAETAEEENLQARPPVVTIMGHVDHGKTTLLDAVRKARVAAGEAGGITQHIGAYQVQSDSGPVTFIDTPGHEAFTAMRTRGAQVTDIVVLVVAADDGVQPQTMESIAHAKAAGVPIVVAVNKMDKVGASMDPIMNRLAEQELVPEQWGGDTMYVGVSALKGDGIDNLLEAILLQAEVLDLRANPDRFAEGVVLEAKMERGRGAVATVLVQKGTLRRGDHVVLGSAFGKVRAIVDHTGATLKEAPPSTPVELFGLSELPEVGDTVHAVKSEQNARALAEHRANAKREAAMATIRKASREDLFARGSAEDRVRFHMILKADVGGSLQALKTAVEKIEVDGAECRILLSGVGDITESDVNLAASEGAHILAFNVKFDAKARQAASQLGVEPEFYSVIYNLLDRVERGMKGLLAPVTTLVRQGTVEVRQLFRISKVGVVAGSYVIDGKVARGHRVKILRDGSVIHEGKITGLKRFKDDVREVTAGLECGVFVDYGDIQEGDLIETYAEEIVEQG